MNLQRAIQLRIINLCNKHGIKTNKLATLAGVHQSTIDDIIKGVSKKVEVRTILRICLGLNMQLKDFFDDELFYNLDDN